MTLYAANFHSRFLDLDKIPKILRTRMYDHLSRFEGLSTLILGSGSGGWVPDAYSDKFSVALPSLRQLVHFSLKYDCTPNVLKVLSESCQVGRPTAHFSSPSFSQVLDDCQSIANEWHDSHQEELSSNSSDLTLSLLTVTFGTPKKLNHH